MQRVEAASTALISTSAARLVAGIGAMARMVAMVETVPTAR
jgi:hypothetical protein